MTNNLPSPDVRRLDPRLRNRRVAACLAVAVLGALLMRNPWAASSVSADSTANAANAANAASDRGSVSIAPTDVALTFARIEDAARERTLAVLAYEGGTVTAVDMERALGRPAAGDAITLYGELGYERLRRAIESAPADARMQVEAARLAIPVDLGAHHIAAGTNFRDHAGEAGVEDGPFLFAKKVEPTGPRADVSARGGLLDYEVELAWVALGPLGAADRPDTMGLIACNDFTDRETLLRHLDVWDVASGKGFTTGKSFPGYLPVGDLFVIPRDARAFASALVLHLYVDGTLRQQAAQSLQVWDLDDLLAEIWARRDLMFDHRGTAVSLLPEPGLIPARTMLMAGTPSGTVFHGIDMQHRARGVARWLLGGWSRSLPEHVIDAYVAAAHEDGFYLTAGDRVDIHVDRLGRLSNEVTP